MKLFAYVRIWLVVVGLLVWECPALLADTYTVTDATCDTIAAGSLGAAVVQANQHAGLDNIQFNLPAGTSLTVFRSLTFTDSVVVDGGLNSIVAGTNQTADLFHFGANTDNSQVKNISVVSSVDGITLDAGKNIKIQGCRIGTDWVNSANRGNRIGIRVNSSAQAIIGGDRTAGEGNVISGNTVVAWAGIFLDGTFGNTLCGNIVGLSSDQNTALPNFVGVSLADSSGNNIGLPLPGYDNVIAGNSWFQFRSVTVTAQAVRWNVAQNNFVGLSAGNKAFPSFLDGLRFDYADNCLIGGNRAAGSLERNVVSGNAGFGIVVIGNGNTIADNLVGTDATGVIGIGNGASSAGIGVGGNGNIIGGSCQTPGPNYGNLCSGNETGILVDGTEVSSGTWVAGNVVGLNLAGNAAIPNENGIIDTAFNTVIGDPNPIYRNVISGNTLVAAGTILGKIIGNYFGTNLAGTSAIPNQDQNILLWNANACQVGGTQPGERNIICGGKKGVTLMGDDDGIMLYATGNTVVGNWLGVLPDGSVAPQSMVDAILVSTNAYGNSIGLRATGQGNLIAGAVNGITVDGASQIGNGIFGNTICSFSGIGINLHAGGNQSKSIPVITQADTSQIAGSSLANNFIEIFRAEPRPGQSGGSLERLGSTSANGAGAWALSSPGVAAGQLVCALATDGNNNTSGFSVNASVSSVGPTATPTPTMTPVESTPTATVTPHTGCGFSWPQSHCVSATRKEANHLFNEPGRKHGS